MRSLFYDKATRKKVFRRIGLLASLLLLFLLLRQIQTRIAASAGGWRALSTASPFYGIGALLLLPAGFLVEAHKWRQLIEAASGKSIRLREALQSVLCGTAAASVTPNRVGDYPGRILALRSVSLENGTVAGALGAGSQFATLFLWALPAVFGTQIPGNLIPPAALALLTTAGAVLALVIYFHTDRWIAFLLRIPLLRRLVPVSQQPAASTISPQVLRKALGWSMVRFAVYTTQFWLLLYWLSVPILPLEGWIRCAFFFSLLAVIPNFALAEIGIRGAVALFLFDTSGNSSAAVFMASLVLWITNLALPSLLGALLWLRKHKTFPPQGRPKSIS